MPLPMQGDKLIPSHQYVVRRCFRPHPPDRSRGDRLFDPADEVGEATPGQFGARYVAIRCAVMGKKVNQGRLQFLGLGMAEFEPGEVFQMVVQKPGMVNRRLQDQGLAAGDSGAMPPMNRTVRELRAGNHVGLAADQRRRALEWPVPAEPVRRAARRRSTSVKTRIVAYEWTPRR